MITFIRNDRLWGGRDKNKIPQTSPSSSNWTIGVFIQLDNRGIFKMKMSVIRKMFYPPKVDQEEKLWSLELNERTLSCWGSWKPMFRPTKESRIWQTLRAVGKPNWGTLTIKVMVWFFPLPLHEHRIKYDLDWTPLSRVTASQSLDFFCFQYKKIRRQTVGNGTIGVFKWRFTTKVDLDQKSKVIYPH